MNASRDGRRGSSPAWRAQTPKSAARRRRRLAESFEDAGRRRHLSGPMAFGVSVQRVHIPDRPQDPHQRGRIAADARQPALLDAINAVAVRTESRGAGLDPAHVLAMTARANDVWSEAGGDVPSHVKPPYPARILRLLTRAVTSTGGDFAHASGLPAQGGPHEAGREAGEASLCGARSVRRHLARRPLVPAAASFSGRA